MSAINSLASNQLRYTAMSPHSVVVHMARGNVSFAVEIALLHAWHIIRQP